MNQKIYISPDRFCDGNNERLNAKELAEEVNRLRKSTPASAGIVSMYDIFTDDTSNYSPNGAHLTGVNVNGVSVQFKDILRGISSKVGGEYGSADDALEIAKYFVFISKSLKAAAKSIDANRKQNIEVLENNTKIAQAKELHDAQYRHETTLGAQALTAIVADENARNRIQELEAAVDNLNKGDK